MRIYGLIGFPLAHSFSETYFSEKFFRENIQDVSYRNFPLEKIDDFHNLVSNNKDILGLNVTIPFKETVINLIDELDNSAAEIGAVNTIKIFRSNNKIITKGYNTDYFGFKKSIESLLHNHHKAALILGTGGASKAIKYVLSKSEIPFLFVSRNKTDINTITYKQLTEDIIHSHQIIINTTPLGMFPDIEKYPDIPYNLLTSQHLLFDLIYNPKETAFLKKGAEQGAQTKNGLEMLYFQAEKSWEIWNNLI